MFQNIEAKYMNYKNAMTIRIVYGMLHYTKNQYIAQKKYQKNKYTQVNNVV